MEFKEKDKAIYLQIADSICDGILSGSMSAGERIPSVRAYAAEVEVNANTAMRSYDYLSGIEVIFNKRGIGYFVADDAVEKIKKLRSSRFLDNELNEVFRQLHLLEVSPEKLKQMYNLYLDRNEKDN